MEGVEASSCDGRALGKRKREYPCTWGGCTHASTTNDHLKVHVRRHTGEKPYTCDWPGCDYAFVDSGNLTAHKRKHTGEKPYACDWLDCGYTCTVSSSLTVHKRRHSGEKPYVCDFTGCGQTFAESGHLVTHKRRHTGEKPHACDWPGCGKTFAKSGALTVHKRRHTGEKPYACDWPGCGYACAKSGDLATHKRRHTGEKPYACDWPDCGQAFTGSGDLTKHKRVHSGEKPFVCEEDGCDYCSAQAGNLKTHMRSMHTAEGIQRQKRSENRLALALTSAGVDYVREHYVDASCVRGHGTSRRIDFLLTHHAADGSGRGVVIAIENDEYQHDTEDADCHCKRMAEVVEALALGGNMLPVAFLRFNPHGFSRDGFPCRTLYKDRVPKLLAAIADLKARVDAGADEPLPPLSVRYLFYDEDADDRPCLLRDPLYAPELLPCVAVP